MVTAVLDFLLAARMALCALSLHARGPYLSGAMFRAAVRVSF
jgi:hypothetical protein